MSIIWKIQNSFKLIRKARLCYHCKWNLYLNNKIIQSWSKHPNLKDPEKSSRSATIPEDNIAEPSFFSRFAHQKPPWSSCHLLLHILNDPSQNVQELYSTDNQATQKIHRKFKKCISNILLCKVLEGNSNILNVGKESVKTKHIPCVRKN